MNHSHNFLDKTGRRFGRLLVVCYGGKNKHGQSMWVVKCDCGKERRVLISSLTAGRTKSCGCIRVEVSAKRATTHGLGDTSNPEYSRWSNMIQRCSNPKASYYDCYGGRGIKVCKRWLKFENFLKDMGHPPAATHQIDRIDVNGDYRPKNCRWATRKEQGNNRRNNKFLTYKGKTQTASEWGEELGVKPKTISSRILYYGWSVERALTTPV